MNLKNNLVNLSKGRILESNPYDNLTTDEQREVKRIEKELGQKAQSKKFHHTTRLRVHYPRCKDINKIVGYFAKQGLFCSYGLVKTKGQIREYDLMFAWHEFGTNYVAPTISTIVTNKNDNHTKVELDLSKINIESKNAKIPVNNIRPIPTF